MKISGIKVKFTKEDALDSIKEYVKVDDLTVESIDFENKISIECTYKKGIKIKLKVKIQIDRVMGNVLYLNVVEANIGKIHILDKIKNMVLKNILKDFEKYGVNINKNIISVDIEDLCKQIPFVEFKLIGLNIIEGDIEAEVKDLVITKDNEVKEEIQKLEELVAEKKIGPIINTEDKYTDLRMKISRKVPARYLEVSEYAFLVPDILILFGRLIKDKRVPTKNKMVIGCIAAYFVSPIDLAMLFIPFVGGISAIALAFYGLSYVMEKLPEQIIIENWQGKQEFALKIKDIVEFLNKASGGRNIDKLINLSKLTPVKAYAKK